VPFQQPIQDHSSFLKKSNKCINNNLATNYIIQAIIYKHKTSLQCKEGRQTAQKTTSRSSQSDCMATTTRGYFRQKEKKAPKPRGRVNTRGGEIAWRGTNIFVEENGKPGDGSTPEGEIKHGGAPICL